MIAKQPLLQIWLPLAIFALLVCLRMPDIVLQGRFWAEEGRQFFANAWALPPLSALLAPYGGYLNLVANGAPLAARWLLPLEWAPYATIVTGLFFQLCPPLLLLTARDAWLQPLHVRAAALLLLLLVPASEEIWLQTLHCQFELLLCCAIILALDISSGWRAGLRLALLALAPLTGVVAVALLPLFAARAAWDRSLPRLVQLGTLGVFSAVQLLFFFHAVSGRGYVLHPVLLLCGITIRHLALPFLGADAANRIGAAIRASLKLSHVPVVAVVLPLVAGTGLVAVTVRERRLGPDFWLLASGMLIAAASYMGAIGGVATLLDVVQSGERYVVVPQSLFYLTVLAAGTRLTGWARSIAGFVVLWLLCAGAYAFTHPYPDEAAGPAWRQEVAAWRADPHHALKLWPAAWTLTLDPRH